MRAWDILAMLLVVAAATAAGVRHFRPRTLELQPVAQIPACVMQAGEVVVTRPGQAFVARVGEFRDELNAVLHYDFLRSRPALKTAEVLLTWGETGAYEILLVVEPNLLKAIPHLRSLVKSGLIPGFEAGFSPPAVVQSYRAQSQAFHAVYGTGRRELEEARERELMEPLERFIRFKSAYDRRVRERIEPVPVVLSSNQAQGFAEDVVAVAAFFELPMDLLLGIGAMENNYMDVTGDLDHAVWKKRAEPGDIILKRRRGQVLVRNYAMGPWQITRETLRYAHRLYLKDRRDYSRLPEHLRPPRKLGLNNVDTRVLTTYAGLLLRHLQDRFPEDPWTAAGAYNGGPANPNEGYAEGVRMVAGYARQFLERAVALEDRRISEMRFIGPR